MSDSPRLRPGYPAIEDPDHPLWAEQQAGWPHYGMHEAMTEAVIHAPFTRGDSAKHPAYAEDRIVNPLATRPVDDEMDAEPIGDRR